MNQEKKINEEEIVEEIQDTQKDDQRVDAQDCEDEEVSEKRLFKKKKKKEDIFEEEIASLKEELAISKNAYFKAYADTENMKRRLQNEADQAKKYRIQSFALDILPAIDNLERAIAVQVEDEEMKGYVEGVKMIHLQLKTSLEKEGVVAINCINQQFDPNIHQALLTEKVEGVEAGIVIEEIQKGYLLKDRVLRASLVKVSE